MTYSQYPQRHFIIGNGASLRKTPLHLLKNEISWGMNRIHLLYPETDWRPTFYFMIDHNQSNDQGYWRECVYANCDRQKFLWAQFKEGFEGEPGVGEVPRTTWLERCQKHHYYMGDNHMKRAESWHLPEICTAFSGLGAVMQLAVLHGATELVLLGCDLYTPTENYNDNFFTPVYTNDLRERAKMDNTNMTHLHRVAARSCPVPIYNATYGGLLEVHPRVKLEEIL